MEGGDHPSYTVELAENLSAVDGAFLAMAPFVGNTLCAVLIFLIAYSLNTVLSNYVASILFIALLWAGGSVGFHAFPTEQVVDAIGTPGEQDLSTGGELFADLVQWFGYFLGLWRRIFLVNFLYSGAILVLSTYIAGWIFL